MSSPLAIAAVTYVIKQMLYESVNDSNATGLATLSPQVTTDPPDNVNISTTPIPNLLNLYMYMVKPNQGWRNQDFPSHDHQGRRKTNPFLAIDLHYMLSAYGASDVNSDMLLGHGMLTLHEYPVLIRSEISSILGAIDPDDNLLALVSSDIENQIEQIKITIDPLNTEEISRLWAAFQAKCRHSAFYKVSVLLIERPIPVRVVQPVRTPNLEVIPIASPVIERITSRANDNFPIVNNQKILSSYQLVIQGHSLKGAITKAVISGVEIEEDDFESISETQIILDVPGTLIPGIQSIQVLHFIELSASGEERKIFSSNLESFVLSPEISGSISQLNVTVDGQASSALRFRVVPNPTLEQRLVLYLNEIGTNSPAYSFERDTDQTITPAGPAGTITIPISGVNPDDYLVTIGIDGSFSPVDSNFTNPAITIN